MKKGLSTTQIICIILLWVALCIMLFTIPSDYSSGEKILTAIVSGVIIMVGIIKGNSQRKRRKF